MLFRAHLLQGAMHTNFTYLAYLASTVYPMRRGGFDDGLLSAMSFSRTLNQGPVELYFDVRILNFFVPLI